MKELRLLVTSYSEDIKGDVVDTIQVESVDEAYKLAVLMDTEDAKLNRGSRYHLQWKVDEGTLYDWYGEDYVDYLDDNGEFWDEYFDESGSNWRLKDYYLSNPDKDPWKDHKPVRVRYTNSSIELDTFRGDTLDIPINERLYIELSNGEILDAQAGMYPEKSTNDDNWIPTIIDNDSLEISPLSRYAHRIVGIKRVEE